MLSLTILPVVLMHILALLREPFFWMIVAFIAFQYRQIQKSQSVMFGKAKFPLYILVIHAVIFGLLGGLIGSLLLLLIGVTINNLGIQYLWPVALLLTLIHIRYLCFAYAGGLVCLSSVLFGWPQVHVPALIALIAVLHITESFLIAISGKSGFTPLIMRTKDGQLAGGFYLQNFWPLPLILLQSVGFNQYDFADAVLNMPDWWPLIKPADVMLASDSMPVYLPIAIVAALGYADMAVTVHPAAKRRRSAGHLFIYSFILLVVAILSYRFSVLQIFAALLAPLGHEYLIWRDNRREQYGEALFRPVPAGVMVLDTFSGSPAAQMRLEPGDVIRRVNGQTVHRRTDIFEALYLSRSTVILDVDTARGYRRSTGLLTADKYLGLITVPEGGETYYIDVEQDDVFAAFKRFWRRIKRRKGH